MAKELLKRSEVKEENTWKVSDMYASAKEWEDALAQVSAIADRVLTMEGKVAASASNLYQVLKDCDAYEEILNLSFNYAQRLYDQDRTDATHQAMSQRVYALAAEVESKTAFIDPEILAISEETLEQFYQEETGLELYRKKIIEIQRLRDHCLSAEMEKLIAMTAEMAQTPEQVFAVMNSADIRFPEITDADGEKVRLTHGNYGVFLESPDRRVRKDAFTAMYSVYTQFANTLAGLYNGQIKQQIFYTKARKFNSTLETAVAYNNVSPQVYYNLIETVGKNIDKLHRYVKLRKKCLGYDELHMYDIYTPMIADAARKVPFEEAKETVLKALAPLGEEYVAKVKEGFENRWIDVYENEGKCTGAYSAGAYGTHPFVLLNYTEKLDDMFTLAHEMGHAMHSYYSNTTQPFVYSDYKIFVAEVASTCNEVLLMEYLLKNTTDKKERAYLLNHYLDSFKGTVYRQTMFAEFEMESNRMAEQSGGLTAEGLNELYLKLNQKYYGNDIVSDPEIAYEWAKIPHFYYNFYVYQYATGFSAAVALAKGILKEGAPAVERYKKFLCGGCSASPVELLRIAGVDMESPKPVQDALDVFDGILDEMEKLLA